MSAAEQKETAPIFDPDSLRAVGVEVERAAASRTGMSGPEFWFLPSWRTLTTEQRQTLKAAGFRSGWWHVGNDTVRGWKGPYLP